MRCNRFSERTKGTYSEWCELYLGYDEVRVLIKALEFFTDKRKLPFKDRMLAGDMARIISACDIVDVEEL